MWNIYFSTQLVSLEQNITSWSSHQNVTCFRHDMAKALLIFALSKNYLLTRYFKFVFWLNSFFRYQNDVLLLDNRKSWPKFFFLIIKFPFKNVISLVLKLSCVNGSRQVSYWRVVMKDFNYLRFSNFSAITRLSD
jgi:hypothetical protein